MRKVFGTCKGEGRKCVAEHVFFAEKGKAHGWVSLGWLFFVLEEVEVSEYLFYVYDFGARVPCDASGSEIPF